MLTTTSVRKRWAPATSLVLTLVVGLLAFAATIGLADPASSASASALGYTYDSPTPVYDVAAHGAQVHTSEGMLVGSDIPAEVPEGTVATATGTLFVVLSKSVAANTQRTGTNFIVRPNGETIIVPNGASGPLPVTSGSGFQFIGGQGGYGLNLRVANVRIMDPKTTASYPYPNGYVSYSNGAVPPQTVNPFTGQTVSPTSPWWHWRNQP